jgi:hypothetical protein
MLTLKRTHDQAVLNTLNQFNFWDAIPLEGSATYEQIAAKVGLNESIVRRLLRYAMTNRIFAETAPGSDNIVHTSLSVVCVHQPNTRSWIGHNLEEFAPASVYLPDSLRKWGRGAIEDGDPSHSPLGLAFMQESNAKDFWEFAATDKDDERGLPAGYRVQRFSEAMSCATQDPGFDIGAIHKMYEWDRLSNGATLVDVGFTSQSHGLALR